MSLVSNINNVSKWKKHFLDMVEVGKKNNKNIYVVQTGKGDLKSKVEEPIKLITPTQQAVERAESDLKRTINEVSEDKNMSIKPLKKKRRISRQKKSGDRRRKKQVGAKKRKNTRKGKKVKTKPMKDRFGVY